MAATTELVLSDLHHRVSGVSASVRSMLPALSRRYHLVFVSGNPAPGVETVSLMQAFKLLRRPVEGRPFRIWHVRRNNEMFWGLLARDVFRLPVRLVFTSAAIRRHSWYPRQLIRRMDAVIATSTQAARFVDQVEAIVPHGVDIDRFEQIPEQGGGLSLPPGRLCVGIVGRVRPEKGTDLFVEALIRLLPDHPDVSAVIVGKTTRKYRAFSEGLKKQLTAVGLLDRVSFIEEVAYQDMPAIYQQLDIVCCPARYEGFGLVPLEAMVSGTAVIASRTGAYEDIVDEGETGWLVDVGNLDQLTSALESAIVDTGRIQTMKQVGRQRVRSSFSLTREVEGVASVYERVWRLESGEQI